MDNLDTLRERIDLIDEEIVLLVKKRMEVASLIGKVKKEKGLPLRDQKRWRQALEKKYLQARSLGLDPGLIKKMYAPVHRYALEIEREA